jgi:hypothetical protein
MSESLKRAEVHLVSALELLDDVAAPAEIGAYVDMAIHHLRNFQAQSDNCGESSPSSDPSQESAPK